MSSSSAPLAIEYLIDPKTGVLTRSRSKEDRQWHLEAANCLAEAGFAEQADKLRRCHDPREIVAYLHCSERPEHHCHPLLYRCGLAICPTCSRYAARRRVRKYGDSLLDCAKHGRQKYRLQHITFTTPFRLDDPALVNHYQMGWKAVAKALEAVLRRCLKTELSEYERSKGRFKWAPHQVGYLAAAEWGGRGAKLHFHVLFYGPTLPHSALKAKWAQYTQNKAQKLRIKRVRATGRDVDYLIGYVTKLSPVPPALTPQLHQFLGMKRRRRVRSKGVFYGLKRPARRAESLCPVCEAGLIVSQDIPETIDDPLPPPPITTVSAAVGNLDLYGTNYGGNAGPGGSQALSERLRRASEAPPDTGRTDRPF